MRRAWLTAACVVIASCAPQEGGGLAGPVEAYCEGFAAALARDAEASHVLDLQYRGRPRDVRQARFCASVRQADGVDDPGQVVQSFSELAESLRAELMSLEPTDSPPDEVRGLLREMSQTVRRLNEYPMRR